MCPLCLASLAATVATTAGGGMAVLALAVKVTRSFRKGEPIETRAPRDRQDHDHECDVA